jgi:DNA polymerase III delta subunit
MTNRLPNSKELKKELSQKSLKNIYLFMGEEEGDKDNLIKAIIHLSFKDSEPSVGRFHIDNDEFLQACDFALGNSMFSTKKLCILRNIDSLRISKDNTALMKELISQRPEGTILIFTTEKKSPPGIFPKDLMNQVFPYQFWKFFDSDLIQYIKVNLKKENVTIEGKALTKLIELTGNDIKKVDDAIEMLINSGLKLYSSEDEITNLIHDVKNITLFDFIDSLFSKNKKSLSLLKKLLDEGTPELLILNMIIRQVDILTSYKNKTSNGINKDDALKQCGVLPRNKEHFIRLNATYNIETLKKIYLKAAKSDYALKSSSPKNRLTSNPIFILSSEILGV